MKKENKQPVVYVVRELTVEGIDEMYPVIGWFVSKSYLKAKHTEYTEMGSKMYSYFVNFDINPAIFANDGISIYAENGENVVKSEIFKDYKSCKEYAKGLNKRRLECLLENKSEHDCEMIKRKFKEVMEYARYLEEKYIPLEERQQVSESAKNI